MRSAHPFARTDTYRSPRARVGSVLFCQVRRCRVAVVGFSDGPIRWPVGRRLDGETRGASALVVCGRLADAVRREAAQAVAHGWGVCRATISQWRAALGLSPPPAVRASRSAVAKARASVFLSKGRPWTAREDEAVRAIPPREAARQIGRPIQAVYFRRHMLRVPPLVDRRLPVSDSTTTARSAHRQWMGQSRHPSHVPSMHGQSAREWSRRRSQQ
jgi:hypothetical protein